MAKLVLYTQHYDDPVNFLGVIDEERLPEIIEKGKEWINNRGGAIQEWVTEVNHREEYSKIDFKTTVPAFSNVEYRKEFKETTGGWSIEYYKIDEEKINDITIHSL